MGVDRTDYLFWGVKVDPKKISNIYDTFEAEIDGAPGRRFDVVYDGMSRQYAVFGKTIAVSTPYDGMEFTEIDTGNLGFDSGALTDAVTSAIGADLCADGFKLYLFSHYH